jgi:D-xylose reductase
MVTREEIFITTKLWNNYHRRGHALAMAKKQNESWGLGYIDLFLMHFPCALKYIDPAVRQYPVCDFYSNETQRKSSGL